MGNCVSLLLSPPALGPCRPILNSRTGNNSVNNIMRLAKSNSPTSLSTQQRMISLWSTTTIASALSTQERPSTIKTLIKICPSLNAPGKRCKRMATSSRTGRDSHSSDHSTRPRKTQHGNRLTNVLTSPCSLLPHRSRGKNVDTVSKAVKSSPSGSLSENSRKICLKRFRALNSKSSIRLPQPVKFSHTTTALKNAVFRSPKS